MVGIKTLNLNIIQYTKITNEADKGTSHGVTHHLAKQCQKILQSDSQTFQTNISLKITSCTIFNRNTVKVSYSWRPNVGSIIKSHNKKLANAENKQTKHLTVEKSKNVRWKINVDLRISYTNVQLQQHVIDEKVTLSNDIIITKGMQMRHHYQNTSGK